MQPKKLQVAKEAQDLAHVLKKLRNSMKRTKTKCLVLGVDPKREKKLSVRWDYAFQFIDAHPQLLVHCRLSAVLMTDKQDPSLPTDLSCLYKFFVEENFLAMGMYLKCLHYLMEAFLNKELSPNERVYKAWYSKTCFVVWRENVSHCSQFIPYETFKDLKCAADGLVLYLLLLKKSFQNHQ